MGLEVGGKEDTKEKKEEEKIPHTPSLNRIELC